MQHGSDTCPCLPLTCFNCGQCVRMAFSATDHSDTERLGAMGLREGVMCRILQNADKMILAVGSSRLGVPRDLAMQLFAHEVPA